MAYYKRQTDDCEIELKSITVPKDNGLSNSQIKYDATDDKSVESKVDFIEADSPTKSSKSSKLFSIYLVFIFIKKLLNISQR